MILDNHLEITPEQLEQVLGRHSVQTCSKSSADVTFGTMAELEEYVTINQAVEHPDVPYTKYWLRRLAEREKIEAKKLGDPQRGLWLIHLPSLLRYIKKMADLGQQKFNPW